MTIYKGGGKTLPFPNCVDDVDIIHSNRCPIVIQEGIALVFIKKSVVYPLDEKGIFL